MVRVSLLFSLLACAAFAGERQIKNDGFTGLGGVNSGTSFAEYEGAGVLFTPLPSDYPMKVIAIDVLSVNYGTMTGANIGAYQIDLWDETAGTLTPPTLFDGGNYPSVLAMAGVQFTTSTSMFNRFTLPQPRTITSGKVFVGVSEQLDTSTDGTTIGLDQSTQVPGANWYFNGAGLFERIDQTDGGASLHGINRNWVIRLVLEVPDMAVTVTNISPSSGQSNVPNAVTITGTNFELGARAFIGNTELTLSSVMTTSINATVPAGMAEGQYDVRVRNSNGVEGTLARAYIVLFEDGGMSGAGGGSAGVGGGAAGTGGGGADATGGGSAMPVEFSVDSITPATSYRDDTTKVVVIGSGFATGAQLFIGSTLIDPVTVKSSSVLNATIASGLSAGTYDVVVVNLDGQKKTLSQAFTVNTGSATKSGGCSSAEAGLSALAMVAMATMLRRRRQQPARRR